MNISNINGMPSATDIHRRNFEILKIERSALHGRLEDFNKTESALNSQIKELTDKITLLQKQFVYSQKTKENIQRRLTAVQEEMALEKEMMEIDGPIFTAQSFPAPIAQQNQPTPTQEAGHSGQAKRKAIEPSSNPSAKRARTESSQAPSAIDLTGEEQQNNSQGAAHSGSASKKSPKPVLDSPTNSSSITDQEAANILGSIQKPKKPTIEEKRREYDAKKVVRRHKLNDKLREITSKYRPKKNEKVFVNIKRSQTPCKERKQYYEATLVNYDDLQIIIKFDEPAGKTLTLLKSGPHQILPNTEEVRSLLERFPFEEGAGYLLKRGID